MAKWHQRLCEKALRFCSRATRSGCIKFYLPVGRRRMQCTVCDDLHYCVGLICDNYKSVENNTDLKYETDSIHILQIKKKNIQ